MPYNKKLLASARADLEKIKVNNSNEHLKRLRTVYSSVPEIKSIDQELASQYKEIVKLMISGKSVDNLKSRNLDLQMRKSELLVENKFPRDYLDDIYSCKICNDTGSTKNGICSCLEKIYNSKLSNELSSLLKTGNEAFSKFNLDYYPTQDKPRMGQILDISKKFVEAFPNVENLIFTGGPGLGKTFLSACIARELVSTGYSVFYESASNIFSIFDDAQFRNDEEASKKVKYILESDLLILDDLGTEIASSTVMSYFYTIINTRINNSKPIIISTNLDDESIEKRYTAAIYSRICGYFTTLEFSGNDIRKILANS